MDEKIKLLISAFGQHRIKLNEPLRYHTLSQLQTSAQALFVATSRKELTGILDAVFELKLPFLIIGTGTKFSFIAPQIPGLVIKNRTSFLKIGAVKGKVGREGIGVEEAIVEVDSGVSLAKLNEFLDNQKLQSINYTSNPKSTLGGTLWTDFALQFFIQTVTVWKNGEIEEIEVSRLDKNSQVILSLILKIKAKI